MSGRKHQEKGKEKGIEAAVTEIKKSTPINIRSYRFRNALYLLDALDIMYSLVNRC
jgi:hypothetical protein